MVLAKKLLAHHPKVASNLRHSGAAACFAVSLADRACGLLFKPLVQAWLVKLVTAVQTTQSGACYVVLKTDGTPSVSCLCQPANWHGNSRNSLYCVLGRTCRSSHIMLDQPSTHHGSVVTIGCLGYTYMVCDAAWLDNTAL